MDIGIPPPGTNETRSSATNIHVISDCDVCITASGYITIDTFAINPKYIVWYNRNYKSDNQSPITIRLVNGDEFVAQISSRMLEKMISLIKK